MTSISGTTLKRHGLQQPSLYNVSHHEEYFLVDTSKTSSKDPPNDQSQPAQGSAPPSSIISISRSERTRECDSLVPRGWGAWNRSVILFGASANTGLLCCGALCGAASEPAAAAAAAATSAAGSALIRSPADVRRGGNFIDASRRCGCGGSAAGCGGGCDGGAGAAASGADAASG